MNTISDRYSGFWKTGRGEDFHRRYAGRKESAAPEESAESSGGAEKTCREQLLEKMAEMADKVRDGNVEPTFRIGAMAYTVKEWDKLLEKFDAAEEALQAEVEAQIAEAEKQAAEEALRREAEAKTGTGRAETAVVVMEQTAVGQTPAVVAEQADVEQTAALLTDEITKCSYPADDPKQKHWFITAYGRDGIICKEAYYDGTKWVNRDCFSLPFTEEGQYEKVLNFLARFPQDANLRFAAHENFWKDFLAGEIDEDDFAAFFETAKDGVPDYTYTEGDSTYIDREKIKYAKYMNRPGINRE